MQKPRLISMAANHIGDEGISDLEIRDKTLSCGVHAVLSPKNSFLVYGVQRGEEKKEWTVQHLHEVTPKSALYNQYVRKLVNESQNVFISLNRKVQTIQDGRKNFEITKFSQKYRSILLACIEELDSATELTKDEELAELLLMFSNIELLWHLLQSLIIDIHSGARPLYKLLDWIKWHFVLAETKKEELIQSEEPFNHPEYWDTVIQFLLQGKVTSARSLLAMHNKAKREDFISLDELLLKMPMYGSSCNMSLNEFRIRWKHWQEECKSRLSRGEYSSDHGLESVCKILCGDPDILTKKSNLCANWYHLMISVLLYTDPCITISALGDMARAYYNNASSNPWNKLSLLDSVILAVMELDIRNVINLACSFNDGWWFAVHMMDLLVLGGYIDSEQQKDYTFYFRNFLLLNYADTLMSHSSLWQVGVNYLDHCHESGRELLELYLERIPLKSESKAKKIIYLAKKRNMENLVRTIANVMTSRAMANGKLGTALTWVAYSKDARFADELADRWLKDYVDRRKLEGLEILKNMGSCMLVSDKLTFVGKYCEFHKLYLDSDFKKAASLLVSLISSGIAPPEFQMIMLIDTLPLLETSELIFTKQDTYQLMKCLEETVIHIADKETSHDEKESLIRLALVRNLAKCFVLAPGDSESEDDL